MLIVHHLGISQSERAVWLCEELGIPYELRRYERVPVTRIAPPEYKALHPAGTAPVIEDDGLVLAESGAIVEYIIQKHGGGRLSVPPSAPNYADYLYWLHFANGSLHPLALINLSVAASGGSKEAPSMEWLRMREARVLDMLEKRLSQSDYFAGPELTAADIMIAYTLVTSAYFAERDLSAQPAIRAYVARIKARPAFQRAKAKADPV